MPLYSSATFSPVQWVMFVRFFQGMAFVALRFALRSFQGCVPFVPAAAVAVSRRKIFMGLQYMSVIAARAAVAFTGSGRLLPAIDLACCLLAARQSWLFSYSFFLSRCFWL